jgi:hypothetical protein
LIWTEMNEFEKIVHDWNKFGHINILKNFWDNNSKNEYTHHIIHSIAIPITNCGLPASIQLVSVRRLLTKLCNSIADGRSQLWRLVFGIFQFPLECLHKGLSIVKSLL